MRKIVFRDETYEYVIGESNLKVKFPSGKSHTIGLNELTGFDVGRGRWKESGDGEVKPSHVAKFIASILKNA
jgi:hypothetical protein